jgi:hypothetical protein
VGNVAIPQKGVFWIKKSWVILGLYMVF